MTQAYNLAILANAVDTSGRLNVGTNATGTLPVANGGTGLTATPTNGQLDIGNGSGFTRATLTAGSGISITNGAGSISIAATGGGTVTSVATGNGLQGGTITTSGTLSIACPGGNTVGSWVYAILSIQTQSLSYGSTNMSPGGGTNQFQISWTGQCPFSGFNNVPISGTWRYFGCTQPAPGGGYNAGSSLMCRVS